MERITNGTAILDDISKLVKIARMIENSASLRLGANRTYPVLSTLKFSEQGILDYVRN